ncbi:MAG: hypothetical protein ACRC2K_05015 [Clostridium sp.]
MKNSEIIEMLEDAGLSEVEEVKKKSSYSIIKFFYDFDKEEVEGAKAYANEESDLEQGTEDWYGNWYLPYLADIAKDNVDSILEEIMDELEVEGRAKAIDMDIANNDYMKFVAVFCQDSLDVDMDDVLTEYMD